jgi:hypothetical protein
MSQQALFLILVGIPIELAVAIACARVAESRGRSGRVWGVVGFVTGFFGLLAVCLVPPGEPPPDAGER